MSFIEMNLGEVAEPKAVPAGRYNLTIASAEVKPSKQGGGQNIVVSIGIDEHPTALNITHYISLPKADDKPSTAQFKKLMLKRFLSQFSIPFDDTRGFEITDFAGAHGNALVTETDPGESETGVIYNRLQLDKLK